MSKIALVTGGSRELGKDMALNLAKKGIPYWNCLGKLSLNDSPFFGIALKIKKK